MDAVTSIWLAEGGAVKQGAGRCREAGKEGEGGGCSMEGRAGEGEVVTFIESHRVPGACCFGVQEFDIIRLLSATLSGAAFLCSQPLIPRGG